jgi:predicted ferric reductase
MSAVGPLGGPHALWYATRGTGVVALLLLTVITCLGVAGVRRQGSDRWPRFIVAGLHRNLTLLALVFLGLHIATTVLDGYAPIRVTDAVLPFAAGYRALWLGLGTVAFDLLLALTLTSLLRLRIGFRAWRVLHWAAYAAWPVALVHALGTGSDARSGWMQALGLAAGAAVILAVAARLGQRPIPLGRRRPALRCSSSCHSQWRPGTWADQRRAAGGSARRPPRGSFRQP